MTIIFCYWNIICNSDCLVKEIIFIFHGTRKLLKHRAIVECPGCKEERWVWWGVVVSVVILYITRIVTVRCDFRMKMSVFFSLSVSLSLQQESQSHSGPQFLYHTASPFPFLSVMWLCYVVLKWHHQKCKSTLLTQQFWPGGFHGERTGKGNSSQTNPIKPSLNKSK